MFAGAAELFAGELGGLSAVSRTLAGEEPAIGGGLWNIAANAAAEGRAGLENSISRLYGAPR